MDIQTFQTLLNVIKSALVSIAVVIGGVWGLFTFRALKETAYRKAQLARLEANLRKTDEEIRQIELTNRKQAVLVIAIQPTQVSLPNDTNRYISAVVSIENRGSRNTLLPTSRPPFTVRAVDVEEGDKLTFSHEQSYQVRRASNPEEPPPNVIVRSGGVETIPFFCRVKKPGLHLLTFRVSMTKKEQEIAESEGFSYAGSWVAKAYMIVE